jgi:cation diffusion facilitator family transporter
MTTSERGRAEAKTASHARGECCDVDAQRVRRGVLWAVLGINLGLFVVEIVAGVLARSTALLGDSLDMLGDTLVYGVSLYALARAAAWKARAAFLKGFIMLAFGVGVLLEAVHKAAVPAEPVAAAMGGVGVLALSGNGVCFWLLYRHRRDDLNMRSTWLCSRNDLFANAAVLVAAAGVALTESHWPDVLVGGAIAALFVRTALTVVRSSVVELRRA